jgi:tetratricopeptide (TPR) repeat protein
MSKRKDFSALMARGDNKFQVLMIYAGLVIATLIAYEPVRHNDFVSYDDEAYVTQNTYVGGGITANAILWAFTNPHANTWHPLTSISHMLDCQIFALNPVGHHFTNLLLHTANVLLLFWILKKASGLVWQSAFVAALFAVHPLNVESVAWVAERKNVLSGLFWMITIVAYISYAQHPSIVRWLAVLLFYALATLSKPIVVTLPFVLLLLDYWPLERFPCNSHDDGQQLLKNNLPMSPAFQKASAGHLIFEKVPLLFLSAILSVITLFYQKSTLAMEILKNLPFQQRLANVFLSYISYILKTAYPARLAVLYPHPQMDLFNWQPIGAILILIIISVGLLYLLRRQRYLTVGWLWYLGTLVPVIGLVQVGPQGMADRYTYLSTIGIFIAVSWGAAELMNRWRYYRIGFGFLAAVVLLVFSLCTRTQLRHWKNSIALYEHAIAVTSNNFIIHYNLGTELAKQERLDEAIQHFHKAIQLYPSFSEAHYSIGLAQFKKRNFDLAAQEFRKTIELYPDYTEAIYGLGLVFEKEGRLNEAVKQWEKVLEKKPDFADAHYNIAVVMTQQGHLSSAIEHFKKVIQIDPGRANVHNNLGAVFYKSGRLDEAIEAFKKAVLLEPTYAEAHSNLAEALYQRGRVAEAINCWTESLQFDPNSPGVLRNLAWVKATHRNPVFRDPSKSVELAGRACEITNYQRPLFLDTLAAAYAASGKFAEAVQIAERAIDLAENAKQQKLANDIYIRLELYKVNKQYYE